MISARACGGDEFIGVFVPGATRKMRWPLATIFRAFGARRVNKIFLHLFCLRVISSCSSYHLDMSLFRSDAPLETTAYQ